MSYIVALTGGVASGKTTVANEFSALKVPIIDADVIARTLVLPGSPALRAIIGYFGEHFLQPDGQLNRRALRQQVFSSIEQRLWLNSLLHPLIKQESLRLFENNEAIYLIWAIPLLFENQWQSLADRILVVDVAPPVQLRRLMERDTMTISLAESMLQSQIDRKYRIKHADDIIDNQTSIALLKQKVALLHQRYLLLATK